MKGRVACSRDSRRALQNAGRNKHSKQHMRSYVGKPRMAFDSCRLDQKPARNNCSAERDKSAGSSGPNEGVTLRRALPDHYGANCSEVATRDDSRSLLWDTN
jgi:hypothetical protein